MRGRQEYTLIMASSERQSNQADQTFTQLRDELPAVSNVLDAFQPVILERIRLRTEVTETDTFQPRSPDPGSFHQGVPAAVVADFTVGAGALTPAAPGIISALERGFPAIQPALSIISRSISDGVVDAEAGIAALLEDRHEALISIAQSVNQDPGVLSFVLLEVLRPFAESRAQRIGELLKDLSWTKGYCPICGSWPHLSILRGQEGGRWLKCSFCAHEWRFQRTACPFCETEDQDQLSYFFSEERPFERVEVCRMCRKYIVAADLRERASELATEVLPLGLVYLDVLARHQGFEPGVVTEWNSFDLGEHQCGCSCDCDHVS
jgi:FdhE protein